MKMRERTWLGVRKDVLRVARERVSLGGEPRASFYLREKIGNEKGYAGEANTPFKSKWRLIWFLLTRRLPCWGFIGWIRSGGVEGSHKG